MLAVRVDALGEGDDASLGIDARARSRLDCGSSRAARCALLRPNGAPKKLIEVVQSGNGAAGYSAASDMVLSDKKEKKKKKRDRDGRCRPTRPPRRRRARPRRRRKLAEAAAAGRRGREAEKEEEEVEGLKTARGLKLRYAIGVRGRRTSRVGPSRGGGGSMARLDYHTGHRNRY